MRETCRKMMFLTYALAAMALFLPVEAHAFELAVKVACGANNCDTVNLGQICDVGARGSSHIALSCENVAASGPGRGNPVPCGSGGSCTPFGALVRTDKLGAYCFGSNIGNTNDAVVICDTTRAALLPGDETRGKETR